MKTIIQRVDKAKVIFEDETYEEISKGLLVYVGIHKEDNLKDIEKTVNKLVDLRIFENEAGKVDYSISKMEYELLVISNFSIYGDIRKGNRPSFTNSANSEIAKNIYELFLKKLKEKNVKFKSGRFQTMMKIESINDGPFNIIFDTREGENNV